MKMDGKTDVKADRAVSPISITETQNLAQNLVKNLQNYSGSEAAVIGLFGDLGSGKTTFMQFFGEALGIKEKMLSPTFVIEKIYKIGESNTESESGSKIGQEIAPKISNHFDHLVHIDAYRLDDPREMLTLGWEEIVKNPRNIIAVEWADKIAELLPENHIRIDFKHHDEKSRLISLKPQGWKE